MFMRRQTAKKQLNNLKMNFSIILERLSRHGGKNFNNERGINMKTFRQFFEGIFMDTKTEAWLAGRYNKRPSKPDDPEYMRDYIEGQFDGMHIKRDEYEKLKSQYSQE